MAFSVTSICIIVRLHGEVAVWKASYYAAIASEAYTDRRLAERLRIGDVSGGLRMVECWMDNSLITLHRAHERNVLNEIDRGALVILLDYKKNHRTPKASAASEAYDYIQREIDAILEGRSRN